MSIAQRFRFGLVSGSGSSAGPWLWVLLLLWLSACSSSSTTDAVTPDDDTPVPAIIPTSVADQVIGQQLDTLPEEINPGPAGDSRISIQGETAYPLTSALGDIWGRQGDHYQIDFTLTDGQFFIEPTLIGGVIHNLLIPVRASAVIRARLFSPGDAFDFDTYSYSATPSDGQDLAGVAYFTEASLGFDLNNSGDVEANEQMDIVGGSIEFTGLLPDIELRLALELANSGLHVVYP